MPESAQLPRFRRSQLQRLSTQQQQQSVGERSPAAWGGVEVSERQEYEELFVVRGQEAVSGGGSEEGEEEDGQEGMQEMAEPSETGTQTTNEPPPRAVRRRRF